MKHQVFFKVLGVVILLALLLPGVGASQVRGEPDTQPGGDFVPGEVLVKFRPGVTPVAVSGGVETGVASLDALAREYGVTAAEPLFAGVSSSYGLEQIYKLALPANVDVRAAVAAFSADAGVEYAEPNYIYHIMGGPINDLPESMNASSPKRADTFIFPLKPYQVTDYSFGQIVGCEESVPPRHHLGEDAGADVDDIVKAVANGKLIFSGSVGGYGYAAVIEHQLPNGEYVVSVYGHLKETVLIGPGTGWVDINTLIPVDIGDTVGHIDFKPEWQTVHLHFQIRKGPAPVSNGSYIWAYFGYSRKDDDCSSTGEDVDFDQEGNYVGGKYTDPSKFIQDHSTYNTPFITDGQLTNYNSMTRDQIDQFLENHDSYFRQPIQDVDGQTFDPAEVIAQASTQYKINPQVILTTLQKESGGVTGSTRPSDYTMHHLMGCGADVPLPEPANTARGQLWCAAEKFRAYHDELKDTGSTRSGWQVGVSKGTCDDIEVTPATKAVAGQFTYTPQAGNEWGGNGYDCKGNFWHDGIGGVYLFYHFWNEYGFATWPDDPYFTYQWGLNNTGQAGGKEDADIDAPEAWGITTGSTNVMVAAIDSGVDYNHKDLDDGRVRKDIDWDYVNNDGDAIDDNGHGTHVAGIIAAETNNGVGVAGVMWQAQILPLKVLDSRGSGTADAVASAIRYAADQGADVIINMSLGGSCSQTIADAVNYAYFDKGVVIVAAAGNDGGGSISYPAKFAPVIAVGATDRNDHIADFSNYGEELDVVAPGVDIFSTVPNKDYEFLSGTSMAAPYVAGVAGLLLAQRPDLSNGQVREILRQSADDLGDSGFDHYYGYGRLNAYQALQMDTPDEPPPPQRAGCGGDVWLDNTGLSAEHDARALASTLRAVRDKVFTQDPGQRWVHIYYEHQAEVEWLLLSDSQVRADALAGFRAFYPVFRAGLDDDKAGPPVILTPELIEAARRPLMGVAERGSPAVHDVIVREWNKVDPYRFVGWNVLEVWEQLRREEQPNQVYLPLILRH